VDCLLSECYLFYGKETAMDAKKSSEFIRTFILFRRWVLRISIVGLILWLVLGLVTMAVTESVSLPEWKRLAQIERSIEISLRYQEEPLVMNDVNHPDYAALMEIGARQISTNEKIESVVNDLGLERTGIKVRDDYIAALDKRVKRTAVLKKIEMALSYLFLLGMIVFVIAWFVKRKLYRDVLLHDYQNCNEQEVLYLLSIFCNETIMNDNPSVIDSLFERLINLLSRDNIDIFFRSFCREGVYWKAMKRLDYTSLSRDDWRMLTGEDCKYERMGVRAAQELKVVVVEKDGA